MSSRPSTPRHLAGPGPTLALEGAVLALMAATAVGFLRLFATTDVLGPLLVAVVASQAIAMAGRRLRLPTAVTALVSLAVLAVVVANRAAPETTVRFLPTRATGPALAEVARTGLEAFDELRAPVPDLEPFVLGAVVALWLATSLTDWGAVRLRLPFESVLPAGGLFVFATILGDDRHLVLSTLAFAAAVALYAVVQRTASQAQRSTWLAVERARGLRTIARSGLALGAVALLAGLAVGPRLPGADAEELWTWRGRGDGTRVVVSPYVTIESRLAQQADTELFRVTATEPAYWRTAGLDVYADGVWQVRGSFSRQSGRLPGAETGAGTVSVVQQTFELGALAEIWLPAAYAPARIIEAEGAIRWNEGTGTLSIDRDRTDNTGLAYTIESTVPRFTVEELRAADPTVPGSIAEEFLPLPDDLTPRVLQTAVEVTAGQPTRYDQLRALQDWFLREFEYRVDLPPRQGDPIGQFLDERVGFCQQFAGTFALMARALGAPARVAVGFTWGEPDPDAPGTYVVTGRHAHAWPEVWFEGLGWVPFEPTPGRGAPGAEGWTGRQVAQDSDTVPDPATSAGATPGAAAPVAPSPEGMFPEDFLADPGSTGGGTGAGEGGDGGVPVPPAPVLAVFGLTGSWLVGVPLIDGLLRARRRARARTPAERVALAWRRASEELALLGLSRRPAETRLEFSERVAADRRIRDDAPLRLAQLATTARYHPAAVDGSAAREADLSVRRLAERAHRAVPRWRRYGRQVDPRRRLTGRTTA